MIDEHPRRLDRVVVARDQLRVRGEPGLSDFACYSAKYAPDTLPFKPPASVLLKDQFSTRAVKVKVGVPKLLCLATAKVVGNTVPQTPAPDAHLLCFAVSTLPKKTPVYDQNQFGSGKVTIVKASLVCLPSSNILIQ